MTRIYKNTLWAVWNKTSSVLSRGPWMHRSLLMLRVSNFITEAQGDAYLSGALIAMSILEAGEERSLGYWRYEFTSCAGVWRDLEPCSKVFSGAYISRKSNKKVRARSCNDHDLHRHHSDTTVTALTAAVSMATSETRLEQQYECVSSVWALRELSQTWSPLSKGNIMDVCHERAMAWVHVILRQSRILASEEDRQH